MKIKYYEIQSRVWSFVKNDSNTWNWNYWSDMREKTLAREGRIHMTEFDRIVL